MIYCLFSMAQSRMCSCLFKWNGKIVLAFVVIFIVQVRSTLGCSALMKSSDGYISPDGDVIKAVGSELVLDCVVNGTLASSQDIRWKFNNTILDDSLTEIIDSVTKRLIIPRTEMIDSGNYYCIRQQMGGNYTGVCMVGVEIGEPPMEVANFECRSVHWKHMVCTWDKPENPVRTNYSLVYSRGGLLVQPCKVRRIGKQLGCNFTNMDGGEDPYAHFEKEFNFTLTAFNALGQKKMQFHVDHFSVVIPGPLYAVKFYFVKDRGGKITWRSNKHMIGFKHLHYRVSYRTEWDDPDKWTVVDVPIGSPLEFHIANMIPHTNYTVKLMCVSSSANWSDPSLWSDPYFISKRTPADVPESPPTVILGSFHVNQRVETRSALIFWRNITKAEHNAKNLHYLWTLEDEETGEVYNTSQGGKGFAFYPDLRTERSYNFTIYAVNQLGESKNKTYLRIEARKNMPLTPAKLTVVAFGEGVYNISWKPDSNETMDIVTYTVFWCHGVSNYDNRCEGDIEWMVVSSDVTSLNVTVSDDTRRYRFAVSAENSQGTSSGMYWNTCIVSKEQTLGKMRDVNIKDVSSTSFTVYWNLNCAEKLGILTGFSIFYCPVTSKGSTTCLVPGVTKQVMDPDAVFYTANVDVFTTYQVAIMAVTVAGVGERSDYLYVSTMEGVPSDIEVNITSVRNDSFVVHWLPPEKPNGHITNYTIHYNHKKKTYDRSEEKYETELQETVYGLDPFTNYTVYVTSCTNAGCSDRREPTMKVDLRTKVGVPGQMEPPRINQINDTFISIVPEFNAKPNGPDNSWDIQLFWMDETNNNHSMNQSFYNNALQYIPIDCADPKHSNRVYEIQTRAVYYDGFQRLEGQFSEPSKVPCLIKKDHAIATAVIVGIVVFLTLVIAVTAFFIWGRKCVSDKLREIFNFKPKLPPGMLRGPQQCEDKDYGVFKADLEAHPKPFGNCSKRYEKGNRELLDILNSNSSAADIDSRNRNMSGGSTMSAASVDEPLLRNYSKGCPEHDSSLNSSAQDSISTGHTTCTDEGSLPNTPTPESPDSGSTVKADDIKPITVVPPYATFDHYYVDDDKKEGYSCVTDAPATSLGYVPRQAFPEVPSYSKFGTAYDPEESIEGPAYSKFALPIPIDDPGAIWLNPVPLESPKSPTAEFDGDFMMPYSCLGDRITPGPSGYLSMDKVTEDAKVHGNSGYTPQEAIGPYCQVSEMNTEHPLPVPTLAEVEEPRVVFSDSPRRTLVGAPSVSGNRPSVYEDLGEGPRPKSSSLSSYGHFSPEHQRFSTISSSSEV